jgi:WD40 repeat protein/predicted Ser/Thr protein kinase
MSDIERERLVLAVFADLCETPEAGRAALLAARCADDADLRARVERMMAADSHSGLSDDDADRFLDAAVHEAVATPDGPGTGGSTFPGISGPPDRLGDYRIVRVVGEGGMGTVYEAEQANPRRRVAIKAIRGDLRSLRGRRRFEYEAQVLASLEHPGIARLYEADVRPSDDRNRAFLVMEFVDGVPLDQYVRSASLDLRQRLELFLRICDPVAYAHRMGVIHRDLKPANILVMSDGQPKVLDFGVARTLEMTASANALTADGQIVGTLAYMSPEQFDGRAPVDTRTDVYALGVVLHQLLTGRDPIDVSSAGLASAAHRLLTVVPEPIGRRDRRLRGDLEVIVSRSLEKEPARRYASVEQQAAEVRRHLAGEPIEARADSAAYVLRRAAWRHRHWVAGFAAVLAAVAAFAIYASVQSERSNRLAMTAARARDDASAARVVAEQRAEERRRSLYTANIAFARVSLDQREVVPMRRALDACDADLRSWEWFHLDRLTDRADSTLRPGGERLVTVDVDATHRVAAFGLPDGGFRVISIVDGKDLFSGDLDGEKAKIAVSAAGDLLVVMTTTQIAAHAIPSGRELWRMGKPGIITPDKILANTVRISPDGRLIAASDYYGVSLLRPSDGSTIRRINDTKQLMTVDFTPDSKGLVLAEYAGQIRRLTLEGKTVTDYPGFGPVVQRIALSPDGAVLAAGNYLGRVMIWDVQSGKVLTPRLETAGAAVRRMAFTPDASIVFIASDDRLVRAIDVKTGQLRDAYIGHVDGVMLANVDPTGTQLLSIARDNVVKAWPIPLPHAGPEIASGLLLPAGVVFTPDSATLFAAGNNGRIRAWDRQGSEEPKSDFGEAVPILSLAADHKVARLVTGNADGGIRVWDCSTGLAISRMTGAAKINAVAFSPDDRQVIVGDAGGRVQVWDATSGAPAGSIPVAHPGGVTAIAFHPNGRTMATAGADGTIRTWSWPELTPAGKVDADRKAVTDLAYSPDGRWLAACGESRTAALRDPQSLAVIHALEGDGGVIRAVAFSPDSRRLVTCGHDGTARIWDVERGQELLALHCGNAFVHHAVFSPDGRTLVTADANGSLRLWAGQGDPAPATRPSATLPATAPSSAPSTRP